MAEKQEKGMIQMESVGDLFLRIRELKETQPPAEADWIRFWFRGQAQAEWALHPKGLRESERSRRAIQPMLYEFRAEATILYDDAPPEHDDLRKWLFLMQHYGMPTLLLDWTRSALTALAFAVELDQKCPRHNLKDAAIWVLRSGKWNELSKAASTYAVVDAYSRSLDRLFEAHFDRNAAIPYPLCKSVTAIEPVFNSRRMFAQQGVFTIHGPDSRPMEELASTLQPLCLWKLVVPSDKKKAIRKELYDVGIHLSSLFPDLDHLSACIWRRYHMEEPTPGNLDTPHSKEPSVGQNPPGDLDNGGTLPSDVSST